MEPPEEFAFPFPAYEIQKDFMKQLYLCLENGNLGIFESPTGTGKSLSIICGAVKWLIDHEAYKKTQLKENITKLDAKLKDMDENSSADWFNVQGDQLRIKNEKQKFQSQLDSICKHEEKLSKMTEKLSLNDKKIFSKRKTSVTSSKSNLEEESKLDNNGDDEEYILADFSDHSDESDEEIEQYESTKIYFCSRTHTQLSQFIGELKRSPYKNSVRLVPLASRLSYCVNKDVKRLKHVNLINEKCLQMQRKKTTVKDERKVKKSKVTAACPFLPGDQESLKAHILLDIKDVEEIHVIAEELKTCSYYSARNTIGDGQIIVVPYNSILHKSTRHSLGINLKGNVLIIDEAHNLLDSIERMHSAEITGRNLLHCFNQLSQYQNRFQSAFSAKNLLYLNQLTFCLRKLIKLLGGTTKSDPCDKVNTATASKIYTLQEFETVAEIDTINVFKLMEFIENSKLSYKLQGYMDKIGNSVIIHNNKVKKAGILDFLNTLQGHDVEVENNDPNAKKITVETQFNSLMLVLNFFKCLNNNCSDGRIFLLPAPTIGHAALKFVLLNPAAHFADIVAEARAVVVAGGTMEPVSEFREQLFESAGAAPERIRSFSYEHVVPKENILATILTKGPSGTDLEFNFKNRENSKLLDEVGRILSNLCNIAPGGIVVFLPSYNYEITLHKHLEASGILQKLSMRKRVFREPKLGSAVEKTLQEYADAIHSPKDGRNGSILFSVIGGKLSEGLNFSDNLGRCIIIIGMPYPNIKSPELVEKMKHLNENKGLNAGNIFYENLCIKAVNQCIGRAIRHINDYASVVLLDKRYVSKSSSLPKWIQNSLLISNSFPTLIRSMGMFFADKRSKKLLKS